MQEEKIAPKLKLIENDPWLEPFSEAIEGRHEFVLKKEKELTNNGKSTLSDFATGYLYFGLHHTRKGWTFREWAPNATEIYLVGDFNNWQVSPQYRLKKVKRSSGVWEINLKPDAIKHGDLYKLKFYWEGGEGERIPAYANRVVQDETTKIFSDEDEEEGYAQNMVNCFQDTVVQDLAEQMTNEGYGANSLAQMLYTQMKRNYNMD